MCARGALGRGAAEAHEELDAPEQQQAANSGATQLRDQTERSLRQRDCRDREGVVVLGVFGHDRRTATRHLDDGGDHAVAREELLEHGDDPNQQREDAHDLAALAHAIAVLAKVTWGERESS